MEIKDFNKDKIFKTFYLNNRGDRWIEVDEYGNKKLITLKTKSGKLITRTIQFYESFGNFARMQITYKGKRMFVFSDTILED